MQTCPDESAACPVPFSPSDGGEWKLSTSGESTSRKSSDHQAWKSLALGVVPGDGTEVRMGSTYEQGERRRGEER
jgi:hypothetical protein